MARPVDKKKRMLNGVQDLRGKRKNRALQMRKIIFFSLYLGLCLGLIPAEEPAKNQPAPLTQAAKDEAAPLTNTPNETEKKEACEFGYASWYAGKFHGRLTANGETFDTTQLTAAHKTLPFNTVVKVTNLSNNLYVVVRINDRGPFIPERIIDLSRAAAEKIKMIALGFVKVRVDIIGVATVQYAYTIQVGCYAEKDNALRMQGLLHAQQLNVILEETETKLTRVLLKQLTKTELEKAKVLLAKWGVTDLLIKKEAIADLPDTNLP